MKSFFQWWVYARFQKVERRLRLSIENWKNLNYRLRISIIDQESHVFWHFSHQLWFHNFLDTSAYVGSKRCPKNKGITALFNMFPNPTSRPPLFVARKNGFCRLIKTGIESFVTKTEGGKSSPEHAGHGSNLWPGATDVTELLVSIHITTSYLIFSSCSCFWICWWWYCLTTF